MHSQAGAREEIVKRLKYPEVSVRKSYIFGQIFSLSLTHSMFRTMASIDGISRAKSRIRSAVPLKLFHSNFHNLVSFEQMFYNLLIFNATEKYDAYFSLALTAWKS